MANSLQLNYYPFGMNIAALSSAAPMSMPNRFKYNAGTELNSDFGVDWYETQFRGYSAELGRFMQVDPLADLFNDWTPYQYGYNDPIFWNDPMGLANQGGDSTWVSTSDLAQFLWDNTPDNGSASFEIGGFNPYGEETGRVFTQNGVEIYHEGEFQIRKSSSRLSGGNSLITSRSGKELEYYQTMAGSFSLVYGGAENFFQPSQNLWRGTNGDYYNTTWGGNQWTGGKNAVVRIGKFMRVAGRWVGVAGFVLDGIDYSQGGMSTGKFMTNATMTAIGIWGGPVGWITSGAYFVMVATGAEERGELLSQSMMKKRRAGLLSHPKASAYSGRNLPKSRNPKF